MRGSVMNNLSQDSDNRANRIARFWLLFVALIAGGLCALAIFGVLSLSLWLTIVLGTIAASALLIAILAPPHVRRAIAGIAWPWV